MVLRNENEDESEGEGEGTGEATDSREPDGVEGRRERW